MAAAPSPERSINIPNDCFSYFVAYKLLDTRSRPFFPLMMHGGVTDGFARFRLRHRDCVAIVAAVVGYVLKSGVRPGAIQGRSNERASRAGELPNLTNSPSVW